jgi:hypothetical protein
MGRRRAGSICCWTSAKPAAAPATSAAFLPSVYKSTSSTLLALLPPFPAPTAVSAVWQRPPLPLPLPQPQPSVARGVMGRSTDALHT